VKLAQESAQQTSSLQSQHKSTNIIMPPQVKLPHGLAKDPRLMSTAEKGTFGLLAASIGLGVYRLATSPWGGGGGRKKSKIKKGKEF
jgi:hypothetical protein